MACLAAASAAICAANGVDLREPFEAHLARGLPGDHVALGVGDGDNGVVERRTNVSLAHGNVLAVRALQTRSANVLLLAICLTSLFLLLSTDLTLRALAGASISVGALAADRETLAVTEAAVAANLHQALDVLVALTAEVALNHDLVLVDIIADGVNLILGEVLNARIHVNVALDANLRRSGAPMP